MSSVLVVDDHPTFRRFARQMLTEAGFDVIGEASDGETALALTRSLQPELVLLDVLLPDVSGISLAHSLAELPHPPLVVLTSSRSALDLGVTLRDAPMRGFIPKNVLTADAFSALVGREP